MKKLSLIYFPNPKLKLVATSVDEITDAIRDIAQQMEQIMYSADGVGLAATQVDVQKRIILIDITSNRSAPQCLINPKIISGEGNMKTPEGCLSFPGIYAKVKRHHDVIVEYRNLDWEIKTMEAKGGLLSACLQHEIDHLDGITFYDHLSSLKQKMLKEKIRKMKVKN
ncbi:MAG: peptide deformylase [Francisellaceae bacterium]|jgi:peptide deformylase|nr:peptide deformylase [Francisellaceae bacterium]MBT6538340.1 peptide deformylase [Francisellaceae bacterium]